MALPSQATLSQFRLSSWLFLRLLGFIYLAAFASLWVQIHGLIGSQGISPIAEYLELATRAQGKQAYFLNPSLCWLNASDRALTAMCAGGVILALLQILGAAQHLTLAALWLLYLSLTVAGQEFLSFQWDSLLLETGLLAIFLAPFGFSPRWPRTSQPSRLVLWLFRWLLFRLMFGSGIVKLISGDQTWRNLGALDYHYETQPIPTWTSWYMQQLPGWFQSMSVLLTLAVELLVPLLIFGPCRGRRLACFVLVGFQILILATGNYGFFNLLTIALCILLLDDGAFPKQLRALIFRPRFSKAEGQSSKVEAPSRVRPWWNGIAVCLAAAVFLLTAIPFLERSGLPLYAPATLRSIQYAVLGLRSFNTYGLFAVMTTRRLEIVIEGSNDATTWLPYEFRWKPGQLDRRPAFTIPHMPRLDWQMWFAALGNVRGNPWFIRFLGALLEGKPKVLSLLQRDPFPDKPPRYVRALRYSYHFTNLAERRVTGDWWRRDLEGVYCPALIRNEAQHGRLEIYHPSP
jgi:lipase maturation factor 1